MHRVTRGLVQRLAFLVALCLGAAPVVATFAAPAPDTDAALTGHAGHDPHAGAGQTDGQQSPCPQHNGCQGFCCSACAHCAVTAASHTTSVAIALAASPATVPVLHAFFVPSRINRPPQAA